MEMARNDKFLFLLLALVMLMGLSNIWKSCQLQNSQQKMIEYQLSQSDSLKKMIEVRIQNRIDTVKLGVIKETEKIKWMETQHNEIDKITDIDTLIKWYYLTEPDRKEIK